MKTFNYILLAILAIAILIFTDSCNIKAKSKKQSDDLPNIILFNVDDMGWVDTELYGSTFYQTPNIKRLAAMGMTFTRGYAGAANCAPSRACLMSGQNTPRHGIYTVANSDRGKSPNRKLIPIPNTTVLADDVITIAEMLAREGYRSGSFGKWHLGDDPRSQGFDVNVGGDKRGNPGKKGHFAPYNLKDPKLQDAPEGENLTDRLTKEALSFMKSTKDQPFFTYMTYYAVHTPLQSTPELIKKYESLGNEYQKNATYAGMVETVDNSIGRIVNFLEETAQLENTLIIFTSDNGGLRSISSQHPLRAGKGSYYEGGIRVPFVVTWKNKIAADSKSDHIVSHMDIYPTIKNIIDSNHSNSVLDGISLLPVLQNSKDHSALPNRDLFFHFPIYLQAYRPETDDGRDPLFRTRPGSVIITGDWKLHEYFEDGALELYNLETDIGERENLIDIMPVKAKELKERLDKWREETNAPIPTEANIEYDPAYQ